MAGPLRRRQPAPPKSKYTETSDAGERLLPAQAGRKVLTAARSLDGAWSSFSYLWIAICNRQLCKRGWGPYLGATRAKLHAMAKVLHRLGKWMHKGGRGIIQRIMVNTDATVVSARSSYGEVHPARLAAAYGIALADPLAEAGAEMAELPCTARANSRL